MFAPAALAFLAAVVHDRTPQAAIQAWPPVAIWKKKPAVFERQVAIQAEARNAQHRELDRQHLALLARRVVTTQVVPSAELAFRKIWACNFTAFSAAPFCRRPILFLLNILLLLSRRGWVRSDRAENQPSEKSSAPRYRAHGRRGLSRREELGPSRSSLLNSLGASCCLPKNPVRDSLSRRFLHAENRGVLLIVSTKTRTRFHRPHKFFLPTT